MIVLRAEIIISTALRIIYSDCNFSLLALLSSGIVSDFTLYVINIRTVIWPHSGVIWPHSDVTSLWCNLASLWCNLATSPSSLRRTADPNLLVYFILYNIFFVSNTDYTMFFFTLRWCSFGLKYIRFGNWIIYNSRVILLLLLVSF